VYKLINSTLIKIGQTRIVYIDIHAKQIHGRPTIAHVTWEFSLKLGLACGAEDMKYACSTV